MDEQKKENLRRKLYQKPQIEKVRLVVNEAVLDVCKFTLIEPISPAGNCRSEINPYPPCFDISNS